MPHPLIVLQASEAFESARMLSAVSLADLSRGAPPLTAAARSAFEGIAPARGMFETLSPGVLVITRAACSDAEETALWIMHNMSSMHPSIVRLTAQHIARRQQADDPALAPEMLEPLIAFITVADAFGLAINKLIVAVPDSLQEVAQS